MPSVKDIVSQAPPDVTGQELVGLQRRRDDRPLITLVVGDSSHLHPSYVEPFYEVLEGIGNQEGLDLFLHTTGGQAEVPWALVSLLREYSNHLSVLVPYRAMSGGTHIALAGDELVMGPLSCLGSVDPKRRHHLLPEPNEPHSVQDLKHCMDFIDRQWVEQGSWLRQKVAHKARSTQIGEIVRTLFDKVHPLAVGALEQSYELSRLITRKVLRGRNDFEEDDSRIEEIEERLAGDYFSHGFFIFRDDVREDLELPVTEPDEDVWQAMRALDKKYRNQFQKTQLKSIPQNPILEIVAFIESASARKVLARVYSSPDTVVAEEWVEA